MNPKVSVIMPVYNAEKFVETAIQSIIKQTYEDFELLIIYDHPTDNTLSIVEKTKDDRIRILANDRNRGIAYSRNRGIEEAQGEYIALMDDDDIASLDRFEKEVAFLDSHPEIGVVGGSIVWINETGEEISTKAEMIQNPDVIWCDILFQCPIANGSTMIRKSIIQENNIKYRDNMYGMEDYMFWMEVSNTMKIYNFQNVFLKWRNSESSETTRVKTAESDKRKEVFAEIQKYGLKSRGYTFSEEELDTFTYVFNEYKDSDCKDLQLLYELLQRLQKQTGELYPEKTEAMLYVARNRYLETALRKGIMMLPALGETGFGGVLEAKELPLVSVVIPTHNRADLIERSVQSVLRQTYRNLEIIVVDDGSSDHTATVMETICKNNSNVIYYKLNRNCGPAGARNYGASKAKGDYLAFHDDDDEWHPDKLEIQMCKMLNDRSIDMTFGQMARYRNGVLLNIVDKDLKWDGVKKDFLQSILLDNYVGAPTIVIKKESFDRIGRFCEEIQSIEDWEFAIRTAIELNVEYVPTPLVDVHVRDSSVTYNAENYANAWLYIFKKYSGKARSRDEYILFMFRHYLGNCYERVDAEKKGEQIGKIKKELIPDYIKEPLLIDFLLHGLRNIVCDDMSQSQNSVLQKRNRYINVCKKLLFPDRIIAEWLYNRGYTKVSIYGIGLLGKALIDRLSGSRISIERMIDRKGGEYQGTEIQSLARFIKDPGKTQLVIITPLYEARSIGRALTKELNINWMSIEDILEGEA